MKKEEFLTQLRGRLKKMPPNEVDNALEYYEEYLNDAGEGGEDATIAEWGSPGRVASQIMAQYAVKQITEHPSAHQGLSSIWIVLLAIFASPIAVPVAAAIFAVVLALIVAVAAIILALGAVAAGLALGGAALVLGGLSVVLQSIPTTLFFVGCGLFCAGLGTSFFLFVVWLSRKSFSGMARLFSKFLPRRKPI